MNAVLHQTLLVIAVLALTFAGPVFAIQFLVRRKAKDRARRRSPLASDLLRAPGESLSEQLNDADAEILAWVVMLMVLPLAGVCVHLAQSHVLDTPESVGRWLFIGTLLFGVIAVGIRSLHRLADKKDNLRLGFDGERAVGEELNQLMRKGAFVFHDLPGEEFNVDHVVIAHEGLFAVETKGYSKPVTDDAKAAARVEFDGSRLTFPMFKTGKPLEQAERQAKWLSQWVSKAIGSPVVATPVLALPGWFVVRSGDGPVRVYSGKQLGTLLNTRGAHTLCHQDMQRIAYQIEQRCRTAQRAFRPADDKAT